MGPKKAVGADGPSDLFIKFCQSGPTGADTATIVRRLSKRLDPFQKENLQLESIIARWVHSAGSDEAAEAELLKHKIVHPSGREETAIIQESSSSFPAGSTLPPTIREGASKGSQSSKTAQSNNVRGYVFAVIVVVGAVFFLTQGGQSNRIGGRSSSPASAEYPFCGCAIDRTHLNSSQLAGQTALRFVGHTERSRGAVPVRLLVVTSSVSKFSEFVTNIQKSLTNVLHVALPAATAGSSILALHSTISVAVRSSKQSAEQRCLLLSIPDLGLWKPDAAGSLKALFETGGVMGDVLVPCKALLVARAGVANSQGDEAPGAALMPNVPDRVIHMMTTKTLE